MLTRLTSNSSTQEILLSRGEYQWEGSGYKEWVNEGEYGRCILYSYMKIEE
jgi:GH43 family beta-xylosidase